MLLGPRAARSPRRRIQTRAIISTILIIYALYFLFFADSGFFQRRRGRGGGRGVDSSVSVVPGIGVGVGADVDVDLDGRERSRARESGGVVPLRDGERQGKGLGESQQQRQQQQSHSQQEGDGQRKQKQGNSRQQQGNTQQGNNHQPALLRKDMVMAATKRDNTSWLFEEFPDWHKSVYVVDDSTAELTVEKNKGRESNVFLTYILDNYHNLPDIMLMLHPQRYQWHNDDPYYDGLPMLKNLRLQHLLHHGYVNLRCAWVLGCPSEIHPFSDTHRQDVHAGEYFKTGFMELFPGEPVPEAVGASCCAQFGVTREKVLERPRRDYERFWRWLMETPLRDELSGRIMEYSWHMIFGKGPIHCPKAEECYCNVFGLCNLVCHDDGSCENRYILPPYSSLPKGWPYIGWHGQEQDPGSGRLPET